MNSYCKKCGKEFYTNTVCGCEDRNGASASMAIDATATPFTFTYRAEVIDLLKLILRELIEINKNTTNRFVAHK